MGVPDCQNCRYNYWLEKLEDIRVDMRDCDHYGDDLCIKMNDPAFIEFMKGGG